MDKKCNNHECQRRDCIQNGDKLRWQQLCPLRTTVFDACIQERIRDTFSRLISEIVAYSHNNAQRMSLVETFNCDW